MQVFCKKNTVPLHPKTKHYCFAPNLPIRTKKYFDYLMKKIELDLVALSHAIAQNQSFAIILGEKNGPRRIPIVIGTVEAQAIALALEKMTPARPLTHDLLKNLCTEFDIELQEVIINNLIEGIFYARLVCSRQGEVVEIDSRTSDAIALAVRFGCPIFTYEFIMDQVGIVFEDPSSKANIQTVDKNTEVSRHTTEQLQTMMQEALEQEDYEKAARLRDEINKRR